jgi:hypothetical protein
MSNSLSNYFSYKMWDTVVQCLSVLDVMLALAQYSRCADGVVCRPEIVIPTDDQQVKHLYQGSRTTKVYKLSY